MKVEFNKFVETVDVYLNVYLYEPAQAVDTDYVWLLNVSAMVDYIVIDIDSLHSLENKLSTKGAYIDRIYFCPHHPKEGIGKLRKDCDCRKPKTGLLMKAIKEWNLDKNKCFLIGDKDSDIIAANRCGISSCLFSSENKNLLEIFKNKLPSLKG